MAGAEAPPGEAREALSPAARLFNSPTFNCHIISVMGCRTKIDPGVVIEGIKQTLVKHPRFSSKLVVDRERGGEPRWEATHVRVEDHVTVPDIDPAEIDDPDAFLEDYLSSLTTTALDASRPLWELHLLNIKTSEAESVGVLKLHHSLGDGTSLMSLVLACMRKTSDPDSLPTVPVRRRPAPGSRGFWWLFFAIWHAIRLVWNSLVDLLVFAASLLFLKDTPTPIKGGPGVEHKPKRLVHRTVSLDDIKAVKNAMKMTINDVILGVTEAGLSQYLNRRYEEPERLEEAVGPSSNNLPKRIRLRATILVNVRPTTGIQALSDMMANGSKCRWGNWIGYILFPFAISLRDDPVEYVRRAKATIDRKKNSIGACLTFTIGKCILQVLGVKVAAIMIHRAVSNATMSFSNMVGPAEEISFYGHPMAYLAPSVCGHPQALTIHFQSYMNKMTIAVAVDPTVIPDPHQLCDDLEESLKRIKAAVLERLLG